jgi:hypothetical protein
VVIIITIIIEENSFMDGLEVLGVIEEGMIIALAGIARIHLFFLFFVFSFGVIEEV